MQGSYLSVIAHPEVLSGIHVTGVSSVYTDALVDFPTTIVYQWGSNYDFWRFHTLFLT